MYNVTQNIICKCIYTMLVITELFVIAKKKKKGRLLLLKGKKVVFILLLNKYGSCTPWNTMLSLQSVR